MLPRFFVASCLLMLVKIIGRTERQSISSLSPLQIAMRMYQSAAAVLLILSVMSSGCNTNKKYVKGVAVAESDLRSSQTEDLCKLGSVVSSGEQQTVAIDVLQRLSAQEALAAEAFVDKEGSKPKPRAVVRALERSLLGSGAHREVRSEVAVEFELGFAAPEMSVTDDCELVFLEHLSSGVFADPFQLHRLQEQEAVKSAHIYGDVDLERPAKNSFQSIVELRQRLVPDKKDALEVLYRSEVTLPLHARYPPASSESHSMVNITMPHVLLHCRGGEVLSGMSSKLKQELCIYARFGDTVPKMSTQQLQWSIPSGYTDHSVWVGRLTTCAGLAGLAAIFMASKFSGGKHNSRLYRD